VKINYPTVPLLLNIDIPLPFKGVEGAGVYPPIVLVYPVLAFPVFPSATSKCFKDLLKLL
jgi:hypothetical protein